MRRDPAWRSEIQAIHPPYFCGPDNVMSRSARKTLL
ncbi:hypothetical protein Bra471DRAFT_02891 [Bradyrhizobium sp. WSM471]|nr:hypothetical protein Bra471DRAFT_02891 [Bradyrhizobium sp. WSM471]